MIKSLSMMNNVVEVCAKHRERMHGKDATSKDFKDSFIINNCIENFNGKLEGLMGDDITKLDQSQGKTSKSVNLRSDCYEKICTYSKLLNVPESEICRRILYYMIDVDVNCPYDNVKLCISINSNYKVKIQSSNNHGALRTESEWLFNGD